METINYQLSARQCMTAGWTVRPQSPLFTEMLPDSVEEPLQHRKQFFNSVRCDVIVVYSRITLLCVSFDR
jgi:hypothetical protein